MDKQRIFGLLVPVSSLPSDEGIGTFGKYSYAFVDFLEQAGASIWQMLPLVPTNYGDSPYQSCSASALNYYFIDLKMLADDGLLTEQELKSEDLVSAERRVDYGKQFYNKIKILQKAFTRFDTSDKEFVKFVSDGKYDDFSLFMALKCRHDHKSWLEWDEPYRTYNDKTAEKFKSEHRDEILFWQFTQFITLKQWNALKAYANGKGIKIMGDTPLYLAYDSAEMWKYGNALFQVDEKRRPSCVAGVPPDAFSDDGQLWGNPLYDWKKMKADGFTWWNERLKNSFEIFDILRIDHFRGLDRYYSIPADETTAKNGKWEEGPAESLFEGKLDWNIVAEDLGVIDDGVIRMMKNLGYPGMKVLEFAFDGSPSNDHKPSNFTENSVCYTGTHDNMPLTQYIMDLTDEQYEICLTDLVHECELIGLENEVLDTPEDICTAIVKLAFYSKSFAAIIPMCDLLCNGGEARINFPSTVSPDNWSYRFKKEEFSSELINSLRALATETERIAK